MLHDSANNDVAHHRAEIFHQRDERQIFHTTYCKACSELLYVGAGNFVGPSEVFRIDQHPDKAEQHRKNRNEITERPNACVFRVEQVAFACYNNELPVFHSRRLTRAEHEEKKINCDQHKKADAINPDNVLLGRKVIRHFRERCENENEIHCCNNRDVRDSRRNSRNHHLPLIFREGEGQQVLCLFKVKLRLVFDRDDCSLRLAFRVWHTHTVIEFALTILLVLGTQQDQVEISAKGPQSREQHVYRANDNVNVKYQDMQFEADDVNYDDDTKILTADGNVRYRRAQEHLEADHVVFNVDTKVGDFTNVRGELGPGFFIKAEAAHRSEEGKYYLKNSLVSTCCDPEDPGWTLTLARATVAPNKNVTAKGSVFRLENIPMFYMPYVAVPSEDRSRATGLLIPSTSTSTTKGRNVREAFYWAMNRSADATFTGEYFSKRGPAGAVEFRARPKEGSWIQVNSFFAHDRLGQGGASARILAYGNVGRGFRGAADLNLVSSFLFRQVYEDGINVISSPLEQSIAFLTRNEPRTSLNVLYERRGIFFPDDQNFVLRKFPSLEVGFPYRPLGNSHFYFNTETSLSGVARRDSSITTPFFVERFDLHPGVELPLVHSSWLDWSQHFAVRETAYTHSREPQAVVGDTLNRFSLEYSSSIVGPQLEGELGRWRHVVEPSVDFRYVGGPDQFRETIVVDDVDLVTSTKEVEYALTNRLFSTREVFSWRLAQKYFFDPTFGGAIVEGKRNVFAPLLDITGFAFADGARRLSPIVSTMRFSTTPSTSTDFQLDYDTRDHFFRSAGIIGNVNRGQVGGGISYFFTRRTTIALPNNELRLSFNYGNQFKPGFSAAVAFSYDVQRSLFQSSVAEVGYNTSCYGLNFEVSQFNIGARVESRFRFALTLKNIGSVGTLRKQERLF